MEVEEAREVVHVYNQNPRFSIRYAAKKWVCRMDMYRKFLKRMFFNRRYIKSQQKGQKKQKIQKFVHVRFKTTFFII